MTTVAQAMSFTESAECSGMDTRGFFPPNGESPMPEYRDACKRCPVRDECAEWAIVHEVGGWWAGLSPEERKRERRRRGIAVDAPEIVMGSAKGAA